MEIGQVLGPYRVVKPLGAGGMGEVYQAEDTRLDRMVALKILPPEFADDPDRLARFEREAKAVAALEHPNVVTIHSVEEIDGLRLLTMELVNGRTLAAELRSGALSLERIFEVAVPLSEGLAAAHDAGVVHRDLKPANVMLTDDGRVKILDFGLAKLRPDPTDPDASHLPTEAVTEEGRVLGTVAYMSPEQVKAQPVDGRSDIFSAGVILYEMAAGVRPFRGESWADVGSSIIRDTPASVTDLNSSLPGHLGRIVRRCLEKDPRRRYQSAADLRNDLHGLARETDSVATGADVAYPEPGSRWVRPIAAAVGIVTVALLAWIATWVGTETVPPEDGVAASIRSIAVLPFSDLGGAAEDDFLVEGMLDALITELSKTDLRVIGQSSAMRFRDSGLSAAEITAELGVAGLVEGTVLRAGADVRVSARLIHGSSDETVWADSYDRPLTDVLVLTSELAQAIAGGVELVITPVQEERLAAAQAVDPAAWELYARGVHHVNRFTGQDFLEAQRLFNEALQIDSDFAEAWAGLALAYGVPASTSGRMNRDLAAAAWRAIDRAFELDPDLADARVIRGIGLLVLEWDWAAAEVELQRALELKPNSAIARHGYADLLAIQGRLDEAVEQTRLGRQFDPLSRLTSTALVGHLVLARRYQEAIDEYEAARVRISDLPQNSPWLGDALWGMDRHEEAVAEYDAVWRRNPILVTTADALSAGFAAGGPTAAAKAAAEALAAASAADDSAPAVAMWFARAGNGQAALDWLERAFEVHVSTLPVLMMREEFDLVRDDPRYASLVERLDIPR